MNPNDGGPAYPVTQWNNDTESFQVMGGMSLRDRFAGLAMQSLIAEGRTAFDCAAGVAYQIASEMLKERARINSEGKS